ncbi:hypothetical protein N9Q63_00335 [bacterium]|jgi:hypothetical protein|nr:hypothetical protein [bacterium]MDB0055160.1 hypothetical protein [Bacteroidia bacterium]
MYWPETYRQCRYFRMKPLEGLKADEDDDFAQENLEKFSSI